MALIKSSDYGIRLSAVLGKAQKPLFALVSLPKRVVIEIEYCGNYNALLKRVLVYGKYSYYYSYFL